jgi:hypothetical protein
MLKGEWGGTVESPYGQTTGTFFTPLLSWVTHLLRGFINSFPSMYGRTDRRFPSEDPGKLSTWLLECLITMLPGRGSDSRPEPGPARSSLIHGKESSAFVQHAMFNEFVDEPLSSGPGFMSTIQRPFSGHSVPSVTTIQRIKMKSGSA